MGTATNAVCLKDRPYVNAIKTKETRLIGRLSKCSANVSPYSTKSVAWESLKASCVAAILIGLRVSMTTRKAACSAKLINAKI